MSYIDSLAREELNKFRNTYSDEYLEKVDNYIGELVKQGKEYSEFHTILVSGKKQYYFTLWHEGTQGVSYIQNLSNDFFSAVKKAVEITGNIPDFTDESTFNLRGQHPTLIRGGKYDNLSIYTVAEEDPQYLVNYIGALESKIKNQGTSWMKPNDKLFYENLLKIKESTFQTLIDRLKKSGADVKNQENYGDLIKILKSMNQSGFVGDMLKKIESGINPSTFSPKQQDVLADIYAKTFPNLEQYSKKQEMLNRFKGEGAKEGTGNDQMLNFQMFIREKASLLSNGELKIKNKSFLDIPDEFIDIINKGNRDTVYNLCNVPFKGRSYFDTGKKELTSEDTTTLFMYIVINNLNKINENILINIFEDYQNGGYGLKFHFSENFIKTFWDNFFNHYEKFSKEFKEFILDKYYKYISYCSDKNLEKYFNDIDEFPIDKDALTIPKSQTQAKLILSLLSKHSSILKASKIFDVKGFFLTKGDTMLLNKISEIFDTSKSLYEYYEFMANNPDLPEEYNGVDQNESIERDDYVIAVNFVTRDKMKIKPSKKNYGKIFTLVSAKEYMTDYSLGYVLNFIDENEKYVMFFKKAYKLAEFLQSFYYDVPDKKYIDTDSINLDYLEERDWFKVTFYTRFSFPYKSKGKNEKYGTTTIALNENKHIKNVLIKLLIK